MGLRLVVVAHDFKQAKEWCRDNKENEHHAILVSSKDQVADWRIMGLQKVRIIVLCPIPDTIYRRLTLLVRDYGATMEYPNHP